MKKPEEYTDKTIYEAIELRSEIDSEIRSYFHAKCLLWQAIDKHITYADDCVLIERNGRSVFRSSGVSFRKVGNYGMDYSYKPPKKPEVFFIDFQVTFAEDREEDLGECTEHYSLNVPIDLLTNFSNEKFNKWIEEKRKIRDDKKKVDELTLLKALLKKHPNVMSEQ